MSSTIKLCEAGCGKPSKFSADCKKCKKLQELGVGTLPRFCGEPCLNAYWPTHKAFHKEQEADEATRLLIANLPTNDACLDKVYGKKLQPRLDVIEKLRQDLDGEGIEVPGIVVCGSQSAGKSSVLESISGITFPRGDNICTKCPAVVSLVEDRSIEEPQVILATDPSYKENRVTCDIKSIGDHINKLTKDVICSDGKVSENRIYIRITRNCGPTLTLMDIPGIASLSPNQDDIEEVTVNLTKKYIENESMVVLVVIPASDDFSNPKALRLAKESDPDGMRTIGVVTKVDNLPPDSDIIQKIRMSRESDVQLEQGFIAVRNRTKADDKEHLSTLGVRQREVDLFTKDTLLNQLDESQWGIPTLTEKIVSIQEKVVSEYIPHALRTVQKKKQATIEKLENSPPLCDTSAQKNTRFFVISRQIMDSFGHLIKTQTIREDVAMNIAAREVECYEEFSSQVLQSLPDFFSHEYQKKLAAMVKETQGIGNLSNCINTAVFRQHMTDAFSDLKHITKELMLHVEELVRSVWSVVIDENAKDEFPELSKSIKSFVLDDMMLIVKKSCSNIVNDYIHTENKHVYTQNHYYMDTLTKFKEIINNKNYDSEDEIEGLENLENEFDIDEQFSRQAMKDLSKGCSNENQSIRDMQVSLHVYAKVKTKRLHDVIPLLIHEHLVDRLWVNVSDDLLSQFQNMESTMSPNRSLVQQRQRLEQSLNRLSGAEKDLQSVM